MKRFFAILSAAALLLTGCAPAGGTAQDEKNETQLREVNIVLDWYPNAIHTFLYDAIEKGYYAEEGLAVNVQFPANANDAMSLVAAGRAEFGIYYQQDVIMARANQNVPVQSVGAIVQNPLSIVLSLKEKNITTPKDLQGKRIGFAGTELSEAMVRTAMKYAGADASGIQMQNVDFDLMPAMTTGRVDATIGCLVNHEVPQMEKEGLEVNYFYPTEYGVPNYYEGVILANDDLIQNDPEIIAAFLRASARGFADMKNDPDGALAILLEHQDKANFALDETVEKKSLAMLTPMMETEDAKFLSQTEACWQENIDWLYQEGLITEKPPVQDLMENIPAE